MVKIVLKNGITLNDNSGFGIGDAKEVKMMFKEYGRYGWGMRKGRGWKIYIVSASAVKSIRNVRYESVTWRMSDKKSNVKWRKGRK